MISDPTGGERPLGVDDGSGSSGEVPLRIEPSGQGRCQRYQVSVTAT